MRSHASRICSACAVSMTSEEVRPKWSQRAEGPTCLGDRGGEGDDVVLGDLLDLFDAGDVEGAACADVARRLVGHDPGAGHRLDRGEFDLQPGLVLPLVAPDATHFRVRVPRNHPERQPLRRNLQAVDGAEHGRRQRAVLQQVARDALHVVLRHPLDAFQRLVEPNCRSK